MDEELGGVNPNSFFEQLTEVRGAAETAQKTSNSNLSLLNELKEKVEIISNDLRLIKDKQFADEDRRQKEEMEAKVKEQNEKTKGAVVGDKGGSEKGKKGGGGGIMGFISSLVGGLVGGVTGLAIQGIGGIIGLGAGVIDAGKKLGEKIKGLFVKKKKKNDGKVKTDKLMGVVEDEEEDKNVRGTGAKNRGREGGNFSAEKNERGEYALKNRETEETPKSKGEIKEEEVKKEKPKFYADYINEGAEISEIGPGDFSITYPDGRSSILTSVGMGGGGETLEERFNDNVKGRIQYDKEKKERDLEFGKKMHKSFPDKYNSDGTRKKSKTKDKNKKKGRGILGMIGGGIDALTGNLTDFDKRGGKTFGATRVATGMLDFATADMFDLDKRGKMDLFGMRKKMKNKRDREAYENNPFVKEFNEDIEDIKDPFSNFEITTEDGRILKKGDEGFEEEFKKSQEAFRKMQGYNQGGLVQKYNQGGEVDSVPAMLTPGEFVVTKDAVQKVGADTLKGLNASVGATNKPSLSSLEIGGVGDDYNPFEEKQMSVGGVDSAFTIDGEKQYLTPSQIKKQLTKMNVPYKELLNGMVIPDAAKMTADKMPEYYQKMKTVIFETVPDEKMREKMVGELDKFMTKLAGGGDFRDTSQIEAEMNRYIPGTIENLGLQITEEANKKYKPNKKGMFSFGAQTQNYNEGGLVQPVIESKNESGEMELIKNLSQSVDSNRQTLIVKEEQNQVMNPPNQNPNPVALADTPQTSPAPLQETESPIPFASLLRQSAQRYLNLGNNAMVIS